jgi:hypothetical protein
MDLSVLKLCFYTPSLPFLPGSSGARKGPGSLKDGDLLSSGCGYIGPCIYSLYVVVYHAVTVVLAYRAVDAICWLETHCFSTVQRY